MGSIIMHLCISKKIQDKYKFGDNFLIGAIIPDLYKRVSKNRNVTHYLKEFTIENEIVELPDLEYYMIENKPEDEAKVGYFAHLVEDYVWYKDYSACFAKLAGFDKDGSELFTYNREKSAVKHTLSEYRTEIYGDYSYWDKNLISETDIDISIVREKVREFLNNIAFDTVIDNELIIHSPIIGRVNHFITPELMEEYYSKSLSTFDVEYKKWLTKYGKYTD
jgi:hypothetical protein